MHILYLSALFARKINSLGFSLTLLAYLLIAWHFALLFSSLKLLLSGYNFFSIVVFLK